MHGGCRDRDRGRDRSLDRSRRRASPRRGSTPRPRRARSPPRASRRQRSPTPPRRKDKSVSPVANSRSPSPEARRGKEKQDKPKENNAGKAKERDRSDKKKRKDRSPAEVKEAAERSGGRGQARRDEDDVDDIGDVPRSPSPGQAGSGRAGSDDHGRTPSEEGHPPPNQVDEDTSPVSEDRVRHAASSGEPGGKGESSGGKLSRSPSAPFKASSPSHQVLTTGEVVLKSLSSLVELAWSCSRGCFLLQENGRDELMFPLLAPGLQPDLRLVTKRSPLPESVRQQLGSIICSKWSQVS